MPIFSRRGFAGFLLAPLIRLRGQSTPAAPAAASPPAPAEMATTPPPRTQSRTYRADAAILLRRLRSRCRNSAPRNPPLPARRSRRWPGLAPGDRRRRLCAPHALLRRRLRPQARPRIEPPRLDSRNRAGTRFQSVRSRLLRGPHLVARRESGARPQVGWYVAIRPQHL